MEVSEVRKQENKGGVKMTKRTLVVLGVLALLTLPAFAQDSPVAAGTLLLSGSSGLGFDYLSYTFEPEEGDDWTESDLNFGLTGKLGYFVIDGLAVGPVLDVGYNSHSFDPDSDLDPVTTLTYGGGIWVGYYFDLGSAFYPYASLGFLFMGSSIDDPNVDVDNDGEFEGETTTSTNYGPALWAGTLISFAEGWFLDLGLEFEYLFGSIEVKDGESVTTDKTTMDVGLNVGIGVFF